jgi:hypothetical protein
MKSILTRAVHKDFLVTTLMAAERSCGNEPTPATIANRVRPSLKGLIVQGNRTFGLGRPCKLKTRATTLRHCLPAFQWISVSVMGQLNRPTTRLLAVGVLNFRPFSSSGRSQLAMPLIRARIANLSLGLVLQTERRHKLRLRLWRLSV